MYIRRRKALRLQERHADSLRLIVNVEHKAEGPLHVLMLRVPDHLHDDSDHSNPD